MTYRQKKLKGDRQKNYHKEGDREMDRYRYIHMYSTSIKEDILSSHYDFYK